MGVGVVSCIEELDLYCLARILQEQMFPVEIKNSNGDIKLSCALCKEKSHCYKLNSDGNIEKYQHRYKNVLYKLQKITGIYLGFNNFESN